MRILVFGSNGQVGSALVQCLAADVELVALTRAEVDVSDAAAVVRSIEEHKPDFVINAAAYTAVDRAETEHDVAERVNAEAPGVMAAAARRAGAWLVHYSTDYVFDGSAHTPYPEDAPAAPLGVYGRSKLAGERAVRAASDRYLILRTSWVYSLQGHNFLNTVRRLAAERAELRIVDDQWGSPTYAGDIARATAQLLRGALRAPEHSGTYHLSAAGATTWCRFAAKIVATAGLDVRIVPITTAEYPTAAVRPRYSVLDNAKLARTFGVRLPHWEEGLARCLAN